MKKTSLGFTIIEVSVVIIVISLLVILGLLSIDSIQSRSRDAERSSKITIISEYLEKYYNKNGEYPGCTAMSQSSETISTTTLPGLNRSSLTSPSDSAGTNSILANCADLTAGTDKFAYVGDGTATCMTGAACTKYTLKYLNEEDDKVTTLNSRHATATPITAIAAISGSTVVGQTLTAGALTPAAATATYQWQSATTAGGTYSNISGATSNTLVLQFSHIGKYIKVVATGTDSYSGVQTSAATAIVTDPAWITIGMQTWAKANLNVGNRIIGTNSQTNNSITEKYCYNNLESNCTIYGGLYQWNEAMGYSTTEGAQGLCPTGSHIPTDNDWKILEIQLGMTQVQADLASAWRGTDQGAKLMSGGASGLNIPFAGYRWYNDGLFYTSAEGSLLWSSSEFNASAAWYRYLYFSYATIHRTTDNKTQGFSIRCLSN